MCPSLLHPPLFSFKIEEERKHLHSPSTLLLSQLRAEERKERNEGGRATIKGSPPPEALYSFQSSSPPATGPSTSSRATQSPIETDRDTYRERGQLLPPVVRDPEGDRLPHPRYQLLRRHRTPCKNKAHNRTSCPPPTRPSPFPRPKVRDNWKERMVCEKGISPSPLLNSNPKSNEMGKEERTLLLSMQAGKESEKSQVAGRRGKKSSFFLYCRSPLPESKITCHPPFTTTITLWELVNHPQESHKILLPIPH